MCKSSFIKKIADIQEAQASEIETLNREVSEKLQNSEEAFKAQSVLYGELERAICNTELAISPNWPFSW